jgi:hypothetical protein
MAFDAQAIADRVTDEWHAEQEWLAERARESQPPPRRYLAPSSFHAEDVLQSIQPPAYVEALTGLQIPASGMVCCPLPDHDDTHPSFRAYNDPQEGWFCFGCARGGTIYDLAGELWGLQTRGDQFIELRKRLARALLGRELA